MNNIIIEIASIKDAINVANCLGQVPSGYEVKSLTSGARFYGDSLPTLIMYLGTPLLVRPLGEEAKDLFTETSKQLGKLVIAEDYYCEDIISS